MPRPGFVLDVDRSTPPTLFWHGEGFRLEKLPADRSRVIYAARATRCARRHRRRDPQRAPQPDRDGPAAGAAVPRHEADHRVRRRQPAAAEDAATRRPPARDRSRCSPWRPMPASTTSTSSPRSHCTAGCTSSSCVTRSATGSTTRSSRAACCTSTTPRIPTRSASSARRRRARRSRSTSGPPSPTCSCTSTSTSSPWTAAGSRPPPGSRRTARCATTTTPRPWRRRTRSWTSTAPSSTRATGGWAR